MIMRNLVILALLLLAGLIGFLVYSFLNIERTPDTPTGGEGAKEEEVGETIPPFSLTDYTGKEVPLSAFEGKALVVNIWASWCPFCVDELPDFAVLQEDFKEEVAVIAINRGETRNTAKEFTDSIGVTNRMTFLLDTNESYYRKIGGFAMPETLFVRPDGTIYLHKRGPLLLSEMREVVEEMLK